MPWKYSDEYYKNYTRETWEECAEKYLPLMKQLAPFHRALVNRVKPQPGERILDVCTGPGEPAMTIAAMVAPTGLVTGIDLSTNMTSIANKTAEKRGLKNVQFLTMDAEKLELPNGHFDLAASCFGLQIVTNPNAVAKEVFRVLKPGGRAGFTVWSKGNRAPALDVIIAPMLEYAEPDESGYIPTPYELGGEGELVKMLEEIGFVSATESRVTSHYVADNVEEYLNTFIQGSPIGHSLREENQDVQKKVIEKAKKNIARFYQPGRGVAIPGECVIVSASKST